MSPIYMLLLVPTVLNFFTPLQAPPAEASKKPKKEAVSQIRIDTTIDRTGASVGQTSAPSAR